MKNVSGENFAFSLSLKGRIGGSKPLFASPVPAGRRITAGFTYLQRINKKASIDVWFPDHLKEKIDGVLAAGEKPGFADFPAEWAAVRQFELLQEAGNHKIYDLSAEHLARALREFTGHMHGGGYTVTVATIGGYSTAGYGDELEILDRRLQNRISHLINMLYLEEQSEKLNADIAETLRLEKWDYQMALPHIGATLGAHDLFRPQISGSGWMNEFDRRHLRTKHFFEILSLLPQKHILHEMAIGLQLPESINENQWIYIAPDGEKVGDFARLLDNLFASFGKPTVTHMPGYGTRLDPDSIRFHRRAVRYTQH